MGDNIKKHKNYKSTKMDKVQAYHLYLNSWQIDKADVYIRTYFALCTVRVVRFISVYLIVYCFWQYLSVHTVYHVSYAERTNPAQLLSGISEERDHATAAKSSPLISIRGLMVRLINSVGMFNADLCEGLIDFMLNSDNLSTSYDKGIDSSQNSVNVL